MFVRQGVSDPPERQIPEWSPDAAMGTAVGEPKWATSRIDFVLVEGNSADASRQSQDGAIHTVLGLR